MPEPSTTEPAAGQATSSPQPTEPAQPAAGQATSEPGLPTAGQSTAGQSTAGPTRPATASARSAATPTAAQFRRAVARYATGIAVVTTVADGVDHAMTANSFTSVSLDPLLALVCVERNSRFHSAVLAADRWAVSFLPDGQEAAARWFATRGRPLAGQFDAVPTRRAANGCLLLTDGLAALELRTEQVVPAGDHDILIGAVTAVHEAVGGARPLVYFASTFHGIA